MLLFYVRHGDPIYSPNQLTGLGRRQAEAVAKRLALYGIDQIYSSDSQRAVETSQPLCELVKKEATLLPWANEDLAWNQLSVIREDGMKSWAFLVPSYERMFCREDVRRLGREWYTHEAFSGTTFGEGMIRVQQEADAFLSALGYRHDLEENVFYAENHWDGRVALFAHEGVGAAILSCILDIPYPIVSTHTRMTHTGMSVIEFNPRSDGVVIPKLLTLSNDSHLYREGLPTKYQNYLYF